MKPTTQIPELPKKHEFKPHGKTLLYGLEINTISCPAESFFGDIVHKHQYDIAVHEWKKAYAIFLRNQVTETISPNGSSVTVPAADGLLNGPDLQEVPSTPSPPNPTATIDTEPRPRYLRKLEQMISGLCLAVLFKVFALIWCLVKITILQKQYGTLELGQPQLLERFEILESFQANTVTRQDLEWEQNNFLKLSRTSFPSVEQHGVLKRVLAICLTCHAHGLRLIMNMAKTFTGSLAALRSELTSARADVEELNRCQRSPFKPAYR